MSFNKNAKRIVFIVLGIIVALCIGLYMFLFIPFGTNMPISLESRENIKIEKENRDACLESAKIWMKETYGDAIYKTISIEDIYTYNYTDIWMPTTYLAKTVIIFSTPFYKKSKLIVDSKNHKEVWCDMRLLEEYSFRKIYSKWLKKKLGINDDDIFFYYKEDYIIDYTEIESLENLNENICSKIKNVKINDIVINNYNFITINELMDYVISILNTFLEEEPEIVEGDCRFIAETLNEDRYFIHYKKGDDKLRWYKNDGTTQNKMNIYIIPHSK